MKMAELDMDRQRVERFTDVVRPPTFAESKRAGEPAPPQPTLTYRPSGFAYALAINAALWVGIILVGRALIAVLS